MFSKPEASLAPLHRGASSSGPAQSSPLEAGLCRTAVTALESLPRALLKESEATSLITARLCADQTEEGLQGPSPPPPPLKERLAGGRGFELRLAGLDSMKLRKVICDFNKAEGLRGISCLGDRGAEDG